MSNKRKQKRKRALDRRARNGNKGKPKNRSSGKRRRSGRSGIFSSERFSGRGETHLPSETKPKEQKINRGKGWRQKIFGGGG